MKSWLGTDIRSELISMFMMKDNLIKSIRVCPNYIKVPVRLADTEGCQ